MTVPSDCTPDSSPCGDACGMPCPEAPPSSCPPPLRCRHVWTEVRREAEPWSITPRPGQQLRGWRFGTGPACLLLPPLGGSADLMMLLAWLLRGEVTCISWDWTSLRSGTTLSDLAADTIAVADHLQLERVHVYGAQFGGLVALHALAAAPLRVEQVVVQDGSLTRRLSGAERALAWTAACSGRKLRNWPFREQVQTLNHQRCFPPLDPDRWACFLEATGELSVRVLARQAFAAARMQGAALAAAVGPHAARVRLVSTEGAGPTGKRQQAELAAALPLATAEDWHTTGLHAAFTHPHRVAKLLRALLGVTADPTAEPTCCGGIDACEVPPAAVMESAP